MESINSFMLSLFIFSQYLLLDYKKGVWLCKRVLFLKTNTWLELKFQYKRWNIFLWSRMHEGFFTLFIYIVLNVVSVLEKQFILSVNAWITKRPNLCVHEVECMNYGFFWLRFFVHIYYIRLECLLWLGHWMNKNCWSMNVNAWTFFNFHLY